MQGWRKEGDEKVKRLVDASWEEQASPTLVLL